MRSSTAFLVVFIAACSGQGPKLLSCPWRKTTIDLSAFGQKFDFAVYSCMFDQDLYVMKNGTRKPITQANGVFRTPLPNGDANVIPEFQILMGSLAKMCCGTKCVSGDQSVFIGPPTQTSLLSFYGAAYKVPIQSDPTPRTITFLTEYGPGKIVPCAGTLTLEYGFNTTANCKAGANPLTQCEVTNSAGVAAARNQKVTLGQKSAGRCLPVKVDALRKAMLQVLDEQIPKMSEWTQLYFTELLMAAFAAEEAFQGCSAFASTLVKLANVTKKIASSRDCPYDRTKQAALWQKDPCCNTFSTKCCAPRSINKTFSEISSFDLPKVQSNCSTNVQNALGNLQLIYQDRNQRSSESSFNFQKLNNDYLMLAGPLSTCLTQVFGSQNCVENSDCWTDECDFGNAASNGGQGTCARSNKPYVPFLRCLLSANGGLRADVRAQLLRDYGVQNATTRRERLRQAVAYLDRKRSIKDCVGPQSSQYRASTKTVIDSSGNRVVQIVPANEAGCLSIQQCNFGYNLNRAQCLGSSQVGTSPSFCARCYGRYCREVSSFTECVVGGYGISTNASCAAIGGEWTQKQPNRYVNPTCQNRSATTLETCVNLALCPGPNSPSAYKGIRENGCATPFCYSNAMDRAACSAKGFGYYWSRNHRNGAGLCIYWSASDKTSCESAGNMYYIGARFRAGVYDTQAKCSAPQCQLPNEYQLRQLNAAQCAATTSCSQSCPKCVSGYSTPSNPQPQEYCFVPVQSQNRCPEGAKRSSVFTTQLVTFCYLTGLNTSECMAQNGTFDSCGGLTQAQCDVSSFNKPARQRIMSCRWDYSSKCTPQQCSAANKGRCDDLYFRDYSCAYGPNKATCGLCYKTYPKISGTNIANATCVGQTVFSSDQQIGCAARQGSALNYNVTLCQAAGGTFRLPAKSQAACEQLKACKRWGSSFEAMSQAQCVECSNVNQKAAWTSIYTWTKPTQVGGTPISLSWQNRAYGPANEVISTVPYASIFNDVGNAILKVIGRLYGASLRKKHASRLLAYLRLSCSCLGSNPQAVDSTVCTKAAAEPTAVVVESCNCDASGECDQTCPYSCPSACSYNVTRYLSAGYLNNNQLSRRRLATSTKIYETVKNASGNVIGQIVGNANRYAGITIGQQYTLCLTIDSQIPINPAFTVYDFAAGNGDAQGAPGLPLGKMVTSNGGQLCTTVTSQNYPYWPVIRNAQATIGTTKRPTSAPSSSSGPAKTTMMTTTKLSGTTATPSSSSSGIKLAPFGILIFAILQVFFTPL